MKFLSRKSIVASLGLGAAFAPIAVAASCTPQSVDNKEPFAQQIRDGFFKLTYGAQSVHREVFWNSEDITLNLNTLVLEIRFLYGNYPTWQQARDAANEPTPTTDNWHVGKWVRVFKYEDGVKRDYAQRENWFPRVISSNPADRHLWAFVLPDKSSNTSETISEEDQYLNLTANSRIQEIKTVWDKEPEYVDLDLSRIRIKGQGNAITVSEPPVPPGTVIKYTIDNKDWFSWNEFKAKVILLSTTNLSAIFAANNFVARIESLDPDLFVISRAKTFILKPVNVTWNPNNINFPAEYSSKIINLLKIDVPKSTHDALKYITNPDAPRTLNNVAVFEEELSGRREFVVKKYLVTNTWELTPELSFYIGPEFSLDDLARVPETNWQRGILPAVSDFEKAKRFFWVRYDKTLDSQYADTGSTTGFVYYNLSETSGLIDVKAHADEKVLLSQVEALSRRYIKGPLDKITFDDTDNLVDGLDFLSYEFSLDGKAWSTFAAFKSMLERWSIDKQRPLSAFDVFNARVQFKVVDDNNYVLTNKHTSFLDVDNLIIQMIWQNYPSFSPLNVRKELQPQIHFVNVPGAQPEQVNVVNVTWAGVRSNQSLLTRSSLQQVVNTPTRNYWYASPNDLVGVFPGPGIRNFFTFDETGPTHLCARIEYKLQSIIDPTKFENVYLYLDTAIVI